MREEEWKKQLASRYLNEISFEFTQRPKGGFPDHPLETTVPGTAFSITMNKQAVCLKNTYSRAKLLVMGDLTGACNSSHSGKGFISKGAGLAGIEEKKRDFSIQKFGKQNQILSIYTHTLQTEYI